MKKQLILDLTNNEIYNLNNRIENHKATLLGDNVVDIINSFLENLNFEKEDGYISFELFGK